MILRQRTPGEPLVALALVLSGWVGARVLAWEVVFDAIGPARPAGQAEASARPSDVRPNAPHLNDRRPHGARPGAAASAGPGAAGAIAASVAPRAASAFAAILPAPPAPLPPVAAPLLRAPAPPVMAPVMAPPPPGTRPDSPAARIAVAGGHQLLWLAATAFLPMPPLGLRTAPPAAPAAPARRWSGDGWLLLRRGDGTIAPGPVVGNYGASQMGAVLRYRLAATDPHRPAAYVRATAALNGTREQQVAVGLSARPLAQVPITAMAELREVRDSAGERLRPALALVTELPPARLPLGFTGEVYAQAGYVGGRNPTAFIDGLARAERPLADVAGFRLRAGGGAWAAKQRGASRVDLGPTASVSFRLTDTASARLAADWRFRVGGRSKPDSGPALTLSAGF